MSLSDFDAIHPLPKRILKKNKKEPYATFLIINIFFLGTQGQDHLEKKGT